ncbi:hypothetical protein CAL14_13070 [Bordetella genomosp. 9]|uniref:sensor histidine kinase n=1 Tax=Bordetella genomosp. 9 TaxID=1416803 RepID=UPI000A28D80A|nr:HAMP domain-containing sensor histidine kinase [Bordetella genomosp. 9]ARP91103.1 hypothetical protein CAL14_13070 [Bordetella genomosp. 9]
MNSDIWYSAASGALLTSPRGAAATLVIAIAVPLLLAVRRRSSGFPALPSLLLPLSQALRLALLAGVLIEGITPAGKANLSAACLGVGAAALLWMAGSVMRTRRMPLAGAAIPWITAWLLAAASADVAAAGGIIASWLGPGEAGPPAILAGIAAIMGVLAAAVVLSLAFAPRRTSYPGRHSGGRPAGAAVPMEAPVDPAAGRRQIETRLALLDEVLERQRQMNALLAHEMRSPVSTISAAVQSLQMVLAGSGEEIDARLQRIDRAVARIGELMDQLLVQDSAYEEAVAPRHEMVDLARLATDVAASVQGDVAHRLRVEAPAPAMAWCDGPLTGVVLRNLLHNAVKYSPADQPIVIQVGTLTAPRERTAWIAVADRGPGIDKEDQARIFDPHFRRAAHRETKGMGLGLYLVRKICERQGGTLTVESEPGKGARFTIALPGDRAR